MQSERCGLDPLTVREGADRPGGILAYVTEPNDPTLDPTAGHPVAGPIKQRIGDADRDQAAEFLREHLAAGRLSTDEFNERVSVALTARTGDELTPLFVDLPAPRPGDAATPTYAAVAYTAPPWQNATVATRSADLPAPQTPPDLALRRLRTGLGIVSAVAWPLVIFLVIYTGQWWWLMFPILIPWWMAHSKKDGSGSRDDHR